MSSAIPPGIGTGKGDSGKRKFWTPHKDKTSSNKLDVKFRTGVDLAKYICRADPTHGKVAKGEDLFKEAWAVAERWVNKGTQTYSAVSEYTELPQKFRPKDGDPYVGLIAIPVPYSEVEMFFSPEELTTDTEQRIFFPTELQEQNCVLMIYHPATLNVVDPESGPDLRLPPNTQIIQATPSASSRSLFMEPGELLKGVEDVSIKTNLEVQISRFVRRLRGRVIKHCVASSKALAQLKGLPGFAYLPEPFGVTFPDKGNTLGTGFLLRKNTPSPAAKKPGLIIPFFSLYSANTIEPEQSPILVMLIRDAMKEGIDPKEYILKHILFPVIHSFVSIYEQQGIIMELHGQNTLLELDPDNLQPRRIIARDLDNYVDWKRREELGLSNEGLNPKLNSSDPKITNKTPGGAMSLIFDKSIGRNTFNFMADMMKQHFDIEPQELHKVCKKYFEDQFPGFVDTHFARHVHEYSPLQVDEHGKQIPNTYGIQSTNKDPDWRPAKGLMPNLQSSRHGRSFL